MVALALRLAIDLLAKWDIELAWLQFPAYILFFCVLGLNLAQPGIKTFTCGTALNFLAIAANGGAMPVSAGAIELADWQQPGRHPCTSFGKHKIVVFN